MKKIAFLLAMNFLLGLPSGCSRDSSGEAPEPTGVLPQAPDEPEEIPIGYIDTANARMVVHSLEGENWNAQSELSYINDSFLGSLPPDGYGLPGSLDTTEIYLNSQNGKVLLLYPGYYTRSILGLLGDVEWDLSYEILGDELLLTGNSSVVYGYVCRVSDSPARWKSYFTLDFTGTYKSTVEGYEGTYKWSQENPVDESCAYSCTGTMSILIN